MGIVFEDGIAVHVGTVGYPIKSEEARASEGAGGPPNVECGVLGETGRVDRTVGSGRG